MSVDKILFSLNGRINRQTFWVVMIPYIVIALLYKGAIDELSDFDDRTGSVPIWGWLVLLLVSISLTWIYFAAVIKRLHNRDKSAKWCDTHHRLDLVYRRAWLLARHRGAQPIWPDAQQLSRARLHMSSGDSFKAIPQFP